MKIGIFGDSYGDDSWPENKTYASWIDHLRKDYTVENFSISGSSLYYIKLKFDVTFQNFDKIIFLVTNPGRYYINLDVKSEVIKHCTSGPRLERHLKDSRLSQYDKKKLKIFREFSIHVQDWDREYYFHNLMIQDIKNKKNNTILIPCFNKSMPTINQSLFTISSSENYKIPKDGIDYRVCHLNEQNNFFLYLNVKNSLLNNLTTVNLKF